MAIKFQFNEEKTTQSAAYLLRLSNGSMSKMRLIKLLYYADREAVRRWGRPITHDRPYCMPHGPVLSKTLRLLRNEEPATHWYTYIQARNERDIDLKCSPGEQKLSHGELIVLKSVWDANRRKTTSQIRKESHDLPEYVEPIPPSKRADLSWERVYEVLGYSHEQVAQLEMELEEEKEIDRILGNV